MDILLFSQNSRKAEYISLKLTAAGHTVIMSETLSDVHHTLRYTAPDFVIVDSETFPEPEHDYRSFIRLFRRKFLLFYDTELIDATVTPSFIAEAEVRQGGAEREPQEALAACLSDIAGALSDVVLHRTLISDSFSATTAEERQVLKENRLRPALALLLGCLLRNSGNDITTATLVHLLWSDDEQRHQQTLYAYMNQLRMLLENRNVPLIIEKRIKGTYRIRFAGREELG